VGVAGGDGVQIGRITAKQVIKALARHSPTPPPLQSAAE
jgi:hypothetical protein